MKRLAFALFNLAVITVAGYLVLSAYSYVDERSALITQKRDLLSRLQSLAARQAEVREATLKSKSIDSDIFLSGSNDGVIAADLQTRLKLIAERYGARVRAVQSHSTKITDPIQYVGARLTIEGTTRQLQQTILEIETSKPYLSIKDATIRLLPIGVRGGASEEPVLEGRLDVFGATIRQSS